MLRKRPYQLLLAPLFWWREKMAAIRREHVFARTLFWVATALFAYCLIVLSYALLGDAHPVASDYFLRSAAHHTFSCHEKPLDGIRWYLSKPAVFTGFFGLGPPSFMPLYLLFAYILMRRTGYGGMNGKDLFRVYWIFFAILLVSVPGFLLLLHLLAEIFPSSAKAVFAAPAGVFYSPPPATGLGKSVIEYYKESCGVLYGDLIVFSIPCLVNVLLARAVIKRFHSARAFAYQCVYYSLAMGWYAFPGLHYVYFIWIKYQFPYSLLKSAVKSAF